MELRLHFACSAGMMGLGPLPLLHTLQISLWDCVEWSADWKVAGSTSMHEVHEAKHTALARRSGSGLHHHGLCTMRELD